MLASWLFWTAAGTAVLAGRLASRGRQPRCLMAAIQVLVAAILPWTSRPCAAAKGLLQTVPGEVLGPAAMLLTSFAVLGPLCISCGALFTAGSTGLRGDGILRQRGYQYGVPVGSRGLRP